MPDLLDQLSNFQSPPFERVGTRLVRYVGIRKHKPRSIECDFEDTHE